MSQRHNLVACCRATLPAIIVAMLLMLASACERREVIDPSNAHYLRVYIQDSVKNVTTGFYDPTRDRPSFSHPDILRAVLYDPITGRMVTERFLRGTGQDDTGYYVDGYVLCDPGRYRLMVYNSATEAVVVRDEAQMATAYATTNPVSINNSGQQHYRGDSEATIYNAPELLFVACEDIVIPARADVDTLNNYIDHTLRANTIVDSYYLQVNIRGAQYVESITAHIDGLGSAKTMEAHTLLEPEAAITFGMSMAEVKDSTAVIYAVFNTFGKLAQTSSTITVSFTIVVDGGQALGTRIDITEDFAKYDAVNNRWLIINKEIVVPKPTSSAGGGFTPSVTDWVDVKSEIVI